MPWPSLLLKYLLGVIEERESVFIVKDPIEDCPTVLGERRGCTGKQLREIAAVPGELVR